MDFATVIGLIAGSIVLVMGMLFGGLNPLTVINAPSVMIVLGGGTMAVMVANPLGITTKIMGPLRIAFFPQKQDVAEMIRTLVSFSEKARREGLLALEDDIQDVDEDFLKTGIQLVVDGTDPELVRNILEVDLENLESRHKANIAWFDTMGALMPAFGMIGTLMGLIQMLQNLGGDTSLIGAGMAVALITTLYGSVLANLVFIPLGKKLQSRHNEEITMKMVMIEGTLSIQQGDNPRIVKEKLRSFLMPSERASLDDEGDSD
jgi:chemotaxis protein MotA